MKKHILNGCYAIFLAGSLFVVPALADEATPTGGITAAPLCFNIENTTAYTVYGSMVSDFYTDPATGQQARHHANFKLETKHFAQFCSSGPFYPGHKLDLQLRTLVPIFECRTGVQGKIVIRDEDDGHGGRKTLADCLP